MKAITSVLEKGGGERKSRHSLVKSASIYRAPFKSKSRCPLADPLSTHNAVFPQNQKSLCWEKHSRGIARVSVTGKLSHLCLILYSHKQKNLSK